MKYSDKGLPYSTKILVAWGESISGNKKITEWLMKHGYPELGLFHYALHNDEKSRTWLIENQFPHLLALINGIEGNAKALNWLTRHGYHLLHDMALSADGVESAHERLIDSNLKVFALLAKKMESVKDDIEDKKRDIHKYDSSQG